MLGQLLGGDDSQRIEEYDENQPYDQHNDHSYPQNIAQRDPPAPAISPPLARLFLLPLAYPPHHTPPSPGPNG